MACLGAINYDPGTAVSKATTTTNKVMAEFDTTNLRITFTAPASGLVQVRIKCVTTSGGTSFPTILLGVMEGGAVVFRAAPVGAMPGESALTRYTAQEVLGVVAVSAGSHSFDAAWGTETVVGTTAIKYGGPNNTTGNDAWGALQFEVWEA